MKSNWDSRAAELAKLWFDDPEGDDWDHEDEQGESENEAPFSERIGVEQLEAENAFYFFNNWSYKNNPTLRDEQLNKLREESAKLGIRELGYGEHPERGVDEGYSFAVIFEGGAREFATVQDLVNQIFGGLSDREILGRSET